MLRAHNAGRTIQRMGKTITSSNPPVRFPLASINQSRPSILFGKQGDSKPRLTTAFTYLQARREFSVLHRLLQHSALKTYFSVPDNPKRTLLRTLFALCKWSWRLFDVFCVSNVLLLIIAPPADYRFRIFEWLYGTQFTDWADYSPYGIESKSTPDRIFDTTQSPIPFIVVHREELQRPSLSTLNGDLSEVDPSNASATPKGDSSDTSSSSACALTLRSLRWARIPGGEGAPSDPYRRLSERGSWRVAIESPDGGIGLYAPRARRAEDTMGDLIIEVAMNGHGHVDKHLKQVREGEVVWAFGPVRERKVFKIRRKTPNNNPTKSSLQISDVKR